METKTTPERNVHRARLYKLASLAFDRPAEELTTALREGEFQQQLLESARALADDTLIEHADAVADHSPTDETAVEELSETYASLFGFENGGEVSQYQIEYSTGTILTSTDTIADLSGFYGAFNLEKRDGYRERSDHLCLELEFLSHLALQTAYLQREGDEKGIEILENAQEDFLEDHLGRWVPRFREAVDENADVPFYRELAGLVDALVADDADRFGAEPEVFPETPPSPTEKFLGGDEDEDFRCNGCGIDDMPGQNPSFSTGPQ
ncbi:TorD/DmsD family molecular chaperone [Halobiforma nitratireducens]|uniref:Anaerobic dehydrogenase n=1 Tax=Halobiforma nitratireducens JCM 10879 TaxID=1227454 RepID=M0MQ83_9EURY|nr:molecular chaperone TorD family protein [Halobiforma nitratireducens]EMA46904.1 anaerobic dehydrogenase [Halobiforma nitratireducens JCM 10879]